MTRSRARALVVAFLGLATALPAGAPLRAIEPAGVDELIFSDGFESGECETWSATSNPVAGPDVDEDDFGDEASPTVVCQLPAGSVFDVTDCDDGDADIHPGSAELCNGIDDDCNGETLDGDGDLQVGQACGSSIGACVPGTWACASPNLYCSGETGPTTETCNGLDDDCDGVVDNGFDLESDEQNCGECGNVCQSTNGTNFCVTGVCMPGCNLGFFDCDGDPDNGCEAARNTNPSCPGTNLGTVDGDQGSDQLSVGGFAEAWYWVTIAEGSDTATPLTARISLDVPAGVDFDLYAYCFTCGGTLAASSTGGIGVDEQVELRADDDFGAEDTHVVRLEIRFVSGSGGACANWTLTIVGNTGAPAQTCNP
jgi:hypothetical protein